MTTGDIVHLYIAERESEDMPQLPEKGDYQKMECAAEGELAFTDSELHYYPEVPIDLYAFYQKDITTQCDDVKAIGVEVYQDQTTEEGEWRSDFLYAVAANGFCNQSEPISMTFKHQLARLKFTVKTDTPDEVKLDALTAVEVKNIIMDGTFDLQTGKLSLGGTEDYVSARISGEKEVTAIVIPQTVAEGKIVFCFRVGEEEFTYEVPSGGVTFEAGKQYNYDICLNHYAGLSNKKMIVNMTTENWDEVEGGVIMISKGEPAPVTLTNVANGVTITKADLYFGETVVADIPVENNRMEFVFPRLVEDAAVVLTKAQFYTTEDESFSYYFNNKALAGNGTDVLSLVSPEIGDVWGEGVVFVVGEVTGYDEEEGALVTNTDGVNVYKGRIIATKSLSVGNWTINMSTLGYKNLMGMTHFTNGAENLLAVGSYIASTGESVENYPIYKTLSEQGDWYVPAIYEMVHILCQQEVLNSQILELGGDALDWKNIQYTTSTEYVEYKEGEGNVGDICTAGQISQTNVKHVSSAPKSGGDLVARIVKAF